MTCIPCRTLWLEVMRLVYRNQPHDGACQRLQAHRAQCRTWQRNRRYLLWFDENNRLAQQPYTAEQEQAWAELEGEQ